MVKHSAMERNYHIFYMLAAGASAEQRESWAMGDLETHQFTSQSGCYDRRDGVLDSDLFAELMEAFRVMGFEEEEKARSGWIDDDRVSIAYGGCCSCSLRVWCEVGGRRELLAWRRVVYGEGQE